LSKNTKIIRIVTILSFILMVVANALANILPINGLNTGEVSDNFSNLFAPAGITFSIWGVIYIALGIYTAYQLYALKNNKVDQNFLNDIGIYFSISSVANTLWIFSWHYLYTAISLLLMLLILGCLIKINAMIQKKSLDQKISKVIRIPFSLYFGWITIATIANVTAFLVSINWNGFGIPEYIWTIMILLIGLMIGSLTAYKNKDLFYTLVLIWAYSGILIKHIQKSGFNGQFISIIATVIFCLLVLMYLEYKIYTKYFQKNRAFK